MKIKLLLIFIISFFFVTCGPKNSSNTIPTLILSQDKIYFLTTDYKASYLYSLNLKTMTTNLETTPPNLSGDVIGFQSQTECGDAQNLYLIDHQDAFLQPSKAILWNYNGVVNEDLLSLPINVMDLLLFNNNLYSIGFTNEIALTSPFFYNTMQPRKAMGSLDNENNQSTAILSQNNSLYLITSNYQSKNNNNSSKLFKIQQNNLSSQPQFLSDISQGNVTCYDINTFVKINAHQILITCNPGFNATLGSENSSNIPSLFEIDIPANGKPIIQLLISSTNFNYGKNINLKLGGLTENKNYSLVTIENSDIPSNPILSSYWLKLNTNELIKNNVVANYFTYNAKYKMYIFNCLLDDLFECQKNTLGLAQENEFGLPSNVKSLSLVNVANANIPNAISFFTTIK